MTEHVALLQERVLAMRQLVEAAFTRMKIPFATGYAGFFSWLNLREYLKEDSYEGEQELYKFIYEHRARKSEGGVRRREPSTAATSSAGTAGSSPARTRPI